MNKEQIEQRAYFIWKETGRNDSLANWTQAEKEFFAKLKFNNIKPVIKYEVQKK